MSHFAELNSSGEVVRVIVADSIDWVQSRLGGNWIQTKYDGSQRKNYAGIGYKYDAGLDAFIPPQPIYNYSLDTNSARWMFGDHTDCIYVPIAIDAAYPLSKGLYSLVFPGQDGLYCGVIPHTTRTEVACLELRNTDEIPVALGADPKPLENVLKPFVAGGQLTQAELDGLLFGVQAMAGKTISIVDFIPASWQQFVMTHNQAVDAGYWLDRI